jgi:hypothetical protein
MRWSSEWALALEPQFIRAKKPFSDLFRLRTVSLATLGNHSSKKRNCTLPVQIPSHKLRGIGARLNHPCIPNFISLVMTFSLSQESVVIPIIVGDFCHCNNIL